jgi:hypothetical protein
MLLSAQGRDETVVNGATSREPTCRLGRLPRRLFELTSCFIAERKLPGSFGKIGLWLGPTLDRQACIARKDLCCNRLSGPGFVRPGLGSFVESPWSIV